ncbi:leukocyte surface antigen CD53-like [Frieseomelitta varia]|uniref:leukocyte surface antigen CD53-like n=1 Tax=Frieseomelitta varia TaxID=561572 RepID=UPI001CB67F51|nr:leukocyte surface antigen CD53-like [Frieseomelitta varia]
MMAQTLACFRYFLIGGAIVIGVCGIVESVCAGYFIYRLYEYAPLTPNNVCGSVITLLVMGLITCIIAWCVWQFLDFTNKGQVIIFSILFMIITIINVSAGIWALVRHEQVDLLPNAHLEQMFELALSDDKLLWDHMQSKLRCCGINGPADYRNQDAVPWSCCDTSSLANPSDDKGVCTNMYAHGCQHAVINHTRSILLYIFLLALCPALVQVCFITGMLCYIRAYREKRKDLMISAQSFARASKDLGTGDSLLNQQSKYFKRASDA